MPSPRIDIAIVGGGPAAYTAAIYAARAGRSTTVFEGWEWGGLLQQTTDVENYPGFETGIMGPDLMIAMRAQAEACGATLLSTPVTALAPGETFLVSTDDAEHSAEAVILATGSAPRRLEVPGEDEYSGRGVSWCATCDAAFFRDREVMVVGGGDTACEEALFLTRFASRVTLVHRRERLRASAVMQRRVREHERIRLLLGDSVEEFVGDDGRLSGARLTSGGTVEVSGAFIAVGHDPRTELVRGWMDVDAHGYVVAEETRTSVPGLFAAGDVVDARYQQAITAAGSGCKAAMEADWWLDALAVETADAQA